MNKTIRNVIITAVISLFVGYFIGAVTQTGRCPFTGIVICKDRVAAACAQACDSEKKEACDAEKKEAAAAEAPVAPATETAK